jgi:uncharacterized protein (DUF1800 family)
MKTAVPLLALLGVLAAPPGQAVAQRTGIPSNPDDRTIQHVLNRIGFGARPGDIERVRRTGLAAYIDQQLQPERVADPQMDARLAQFTTLSMSARELTEQFFIPARQAQQALKQQQKADPSMMAADPGQPAKPAAISPELRAARQNEQRVLTELTQAHLLRALASERQLNEVLVDFWFNHFNVFAGKGQVRQYLPEYERDVIRPHVLGSFRELLGAVAHSPAMLFYLDNWQSSAPTVQPARMQARPRARLQPLLQPPPQRQARGLNENYGRELMELHTLGVDGGYTQKDVVEVARALTGWTIDRPQQGGPFVFRAAMHDTGEKIVLGQRFPSGHGEDEGERVLDILAKHPSTARHIAFKLAQRFVADEPPPALVDRAAKVFADTKGDIRQVVRAVVTSPEFFGTAAYRAKVKTPLEFLMSAARATGGAVNNAQPIAQLLRAQLGMPLYGCQPPTGYSNTADAWVNTGALLNRMNVAVQMTGGQARWIRIDLRSLAPDTTDDSRDDLVRKMLAGDVSESTRQVLARAQDPKHLVALVLGSPEFQRR